jgi:type I restriction enzyme S subunit
MKLYASNEGAFPDDWKIVKLSSLCDLQNGYAFKSTDYVDSSNTLSCRMSNIRPDGEFDLDYHPKFLPDSYADKYRQFLLKDNDVIIAMTDMATEPKILGVPTVVSTKSRNVLLNQRVGKLVIKDEYSIFFPYLKRVLGTNRAKQHYLRFAGGGVQINLSKEDLLSLKIPLPPLEEQRRIAAILDKADGVRRKRKEAIRLTEELLKSTFLDLFGDPVTNPKGWEVKPLIKLILPDRPITYGILKPGDNLAGGIPYVRVVDMKNGTVDVSAVRRTSKKIAQQYARSTLKVGDVLLSIRGHVGRLAITPHELEGANITQDTARLATGELLTKEYLLTMLESQQIQNWMKRRTKGAGVQGINLGDVKEIPVPVPPKELQAKFSNFFNQIRSQQNHDCQCRAESENLFNSLLQRAFRGEL